MKIVIRALGPLLVIAALVAGAVFLGPRVLARVRSVDLGPPTEVVAGKQACGVKLGASQYDVMEGLGYPQQSQDSPYGSAWAYDVSASGYSMNVIYDSGKVAAVQCFRPSRLGSLVTGRSTRDQVVARLGQPAAVSFWSSGKNDINFRALLQYLNRGLIVTVDVKTGLVDGFIVLEPAK